MLVVVSLMLIFTTINTNMNNAKKDSEIKQLQNQIGEIKQLQTQVEYLQDRDFILGVIVEKEGFEVYTYKFCEYEKSGPDCFEVVSDVFLSIDELAIATLDLEGKIELKDLD